MSFPDGRGRWRDVEGGGFIEKASPTPDDRDREVSHVVGGQARRDLGVGRDVAEPRFVLPKTEVPEPGHDSRGQFSTWQVSPAGRLLKRIARSAPRRTRSRV